MNKITTTIQFKRESWDPDTTDWGLDATGTIIESCPCLFTPWKGKVVQQVQKLKIGDRPTLIYPDGTLHVVNLIIKGIHIFPAHEQEKAPL